MMGEEKKERKETCHIVAAIGKTNASETERDVAPNDKIVLDAIAFTIVAFLDFHDTKNDCDND